MARLSEVDNACELLADLAQNGRGKKGHDFKHCTSKGDKFTVGNPYDSGEILYLFLHEIVLVLNSTSFPFHFSFRY